MATTIEVSTGTGIVEIAAETIVGSFTDEQIQDIIGAMVSGNTEDGLSVTYDDTTGKLDFVNTDKGSTASIGLFDYRGPYDASVNTFPASGGSGSGGAILKGDSWTISVAGTLGGAAVEVGDVLLSTVDTPGQTASNWLVWERNLGYVPVSPTRSITAGAGLTGGGDLSADRTLEVGQGDGISVTADAVAADSTVARRNAANTYTTGPQTFTGSSTFGQPAAAGTTDSVGDRAVIYEAASYRATIGMSTTGAYAQNTGGSSTDGFQIWTGTTTALHTATFERDGNLILKRGSLSATSPATTGTKLDLINTDTGGRTWTIYSNGTGNNGGAGACQIYDSTRGAAAIVVSTTGNVLVTGFTAATVGLIVKGAASQSANLQEWQDSSGNVHGTVSENGYLTTRKTSAPADGELVAGEAAYWFDATNGAAKFMVKAKTADGTVVTGSLALS